MQKFDLRGAGFSDRVLEAYARVGLPETLTVRAAANDNAPEILLYGVISPRDITSKDFVRALAQAGDGPITLRINSPGGDVFEAMAIYNALKARTAPVRVVVDGLAASAASFVAMAGDKIEMHDSSMLMIHRPWGMVAGNAQDLKDTAATLEKLDGQYANVYAARTGKTAADMMSVMHAETWLTSSEAIADGWATGIVAVPQSDKADRATFAKASQAKRIVAALRAALPDYDPDNDGDNDAQEALTLIQAAMQMLDSAADALTGADDGGDEVDASAMPIIAQTDDGAGVIYRQSVANVAPKDDGIRVENPDDPSQFIMVRRPKAIPFKEEAAANDHDAPDEAAAGKAAAHAARLRRVQLARIDVV